MTTTRPDIIAAIHETIEIPDSAYETAEKRYKDVADWFGSGTARCKNYEPHITPQGSFRIGTVIRPLTDEEEYDLDLSCQLERGYSKTQHSQFELKALVGQDLEDYRVARRIEQAGEEKNRCWRLRYKDQLKFHMDVVPCLPETAERRVAIREAMVRFGAHEALAKTVADLSVNITDRMLPNYRVIAGDWLVSNPACTEPRPPKAKRLPGRSSTVMMSESGRVMKWVTKFTSASRMLTTWQGTWRRRLIFT